jgi:hypothetical protein
MSYPSFTRLFHNWNLNKYFMKSNSTDFETCQNSCSLSNRCNGFLFSKENQCYTYSENNDLKDMIDPTELSEKNTLFFKQENENQKNQVNHYFEFITTYNPNLEQTEINNNNNDNNNNNNNENNYVQLENNWNLSKYFMKSTPSTFSSCQQMCNLPNNDCNGFIYTKENKCYINNSTTIKDITEMIDSYSSLNTYFLKYINENQTKQMNDYFQFLQNKINQTLQYVKEDKNKTIKNVNDGNNENDLNNNNNNNNNNDNTLSWNEKYNFYFQLLEEKRTDLKKQLANNDLMNDSKDVVYSNHNQYLLFFSFATILLFIIMGTFINSDILTMQNGILSVTIFGTFMLFLSFYIS